MSASAVPGIIAWPLIVFMTLVLVGRFRWFNNNLSEKYFNNTLAFLLAAQILREYLVQNMLARTALTTLPGTWQLSSAVLGYSFTEFVAFILLGSGMSEAETRRQHRYYRLAGVLLIAGILVFGSHARLDEQPFELMRGWESVVVLSCMTTMLMVLATRTISNSLRELRNVRTRRERWIALSLLSMGLVGSGIVLHEAALLICDLLGWTDTGEYRRQSHANGLFFAIVAPFGVAAIPLVRKLLGALGLDPISRSWCKLQPLRQAMRTVVPEGVFGFDDDEPGRRKSELQLHHTVVEIRDAILRLRPYSREIPQHELSRFLDEPNAIPACEHAAATATLRLAHAARAKVTGATPTALAPNSAQIVASRAATLTQEAAELAALAKWWPAAYAAAESILESAIHTQANSTI
ncbi:DUF6545 domain-containing protein [Mycobacterium riyadhense]|uniref:DUF6545 domain-containing protein n=3 Tax=Mycobacterium riyadhense TaxID=486698 RepID=UPI0019581717|nr:DUF6545 domain-containing protein [Mycobacterium riyadhense]